MASTAGPPQYIRVVNEESLKYASSLLCTGFRPLRPRFRGERYGDSTIRTGGGRGSEVTVPSRLQKHRRHGAGKSVTYSGAEADHAHPWCLKYPTPPSLDEKNTGPCIAVVFVHTLMYTLTKKNEAPNVYRTNTKHQSPRRSSSHRFLFIIPPPPAPSKPKKACKKKENDRIDVDSKPPSLE